MGTAFALLEPEAVAVHLEDVNVMGEPIEQCAGQALGGEHARPFVEGQVAGNDDRAAIVVLAEVISSIRRGPFWHFDLAPPSRVLVPVF